jgi:hypothetical protein
MCEDIGSDLEFLENIRAACGPLGRRLQLAGQKLNDTFASISNARVAVDHHD